LFEVKFPADRFEPGFRQLLWAAWRSGQAELHAQWTGQTIDAVSRGQRSFAATARQGPGDGPVEAHAEFQDEVTMRAMGDLFHAAAVRSEPLPERFIEVRQRLERLQDELIAAGQALEASGCHHNANRAFRAVRFM
jgi:hypothetical protein